MVYAQENTIIHHPPHSMSSMSHQGASQRFRSPLAVDVALMTGAAPLEAEVRYFGSSSESYVLDSRLIYGNLSNMRFFS